MPYTAKQNLYVTADGQVKTEDQLDENTPATLLVAAGGTLTDEQAAQYELPEPAPPAEEEAAAEEAPEEEAPPEEPKPRAGKGK